MASATRRYLVLGAGPTGVEAAIRILHLYPQAHVTVLEQDSQVGGAVRKWAHVRMFSAWNLNTSQIGLDVLRAAKLPLPPADSFPTGSEFLQQYLEPLGQHLLTHPRATVLLSHQVVSVGRPTLGKGQLLAQKAREAEGFRVLVEEIILQASHLHIRASTEELHQVRELRRVEKVLFADCVFDATGTYGQPSYLGAGGVPALGERSLLDHAHLNRYIPDLTVAAVAAKYLGRSTLVVGSGYSAITSLKLLLDLVHAQQHGHHDDSSSTNHPSTRVYWLTRHGAQPYKEMTEDPLPQRAALCRLGNELAVNEAGHVNGAAADTQPGLATSSAEQFSKVLTYIPNAHITEIKCVEAEIKETSEYFSAQSPPKFHVSYQISAGAPSSAVQPTSSHVVIVDEIISNCGYRPDSSLHRELQVHLCWASEGPYKLAASLLSSAAGSSGDCLAQSAPAADVLKNPEPSFFVVGAKSYGRSSSYLMRLGVEQLERLLPA